MQMQEAHVVHKVVLLALVGLPVQPEVGTELQGLHDCQGRGVDVILLHITHHPSQGGFGLGLTVEPLFPSHSAACTCACTTTMDNNHAQQSCLEVADTTTATDTVLVIAATGWKIQEILFKCEHVNEGSYIYTAAAAFSMTVSTELVLD